MSKSCGIAKDNFSSRGVVRLEFVSALLSAGTEERLSEAFVGSAARTDAAASDQFSH